MQKRRRDIFTLYKVQASTFRDIQILQTATEMLKDSVATANKTYCDWLREKFKSLHPIATWRENGFFDDVDLMDISCHWLQFEPIKKSYHLLFAALLAVLFTVGCVGNAVPTYIILSSKKLRKNPVKVLLANLAVSDMLILMVVPVFIYNSFYQGPAIGGFGCKVYGFLGGFSGTLSICTLAAVAIERYLVISRRLAKKIKLSWAYKTIAFIWIYSAIFASMPLFGFGKYVPEGFLTSCSFDYLSDDKRTRIFVLSYFIGAWMCPLAVITFSYTFIIGTVYTFRKNITGRQSKFPVSRTTRNNSSLRSCTRSTSTNPNRRIKKRGINQPNVEVAVAKVLIKLIVVWVAAWTPYSVVSLLGISGHSHLLTPFNSMVPALFAKTAACVDPFIYSLKYPQVRKEIIRRMNNSLQTLAEHSDLPPNSPKSNLTGPARSRNGLPLVVSQSSNARSSRASSLVASSHRRRTERDDPSNFLTLSRKYVRSDPVSSGSRSLSASRNVSKRGQETNEVVAVELNMHGHCRRHLNSVLEKDATTQHRPSISLVGFYRQYKTDQLLPVSSSPMQSTSV